MPNMGKDSVLSANSINGTIFYRLCVKSKYLSSVCFAKMKNLKNIFLKIIAPIA